jgi:hypothetical protein
MSAEETDKGMVEDALSCYARVVRLAVEKGWDANETDETPDAYLAQCLRLAENDLSGMDAALGLDRGNDAGMRFYGDRVVRLRMLRTELENYRSAARAVKFVR